MSRGRIVPALKPFLLSSLGYGLYQSAPGAYEFDLAATDPRRYRISARAARWFEYYFHFGPSPKEVLEEHKNVIDPPAGLRPWHFAVLHEKQLPAGVAVVPMPAEASGDSIRRA